MNLTARTGAAMAVAAVAGATVLANPVHTKQTVSSAISSAAVELTATSTALTLWPLPPTPTGSANTVGTTPVTSTAISARDLAATADQIDHSYIDFRYVARTDFTAFANRLGYLGKQLYIGYNLIESIVASTVFNGTDIARGEGVLRNVGDIAGDVLLSTLFVAIDEISLASKDTYPIAISRPPTDHPGEWGDALAPNRYDPLSVPPRYSTTAQVAADPKTATPVAAAAAGASTPITDAIDNTTVTTQESSPAKSSTSGTGADAPKPTPLSKWKKKRAEQTAERAEKAEARKAARAAAKETKASKNATASATDTATHANAGNGTRQ